MAEYEKRLKQTKDELHEKYDRYEEYPKTHKEYKYWSRRFDRHDGYKSWDRYWKDLMDGEYQDELDDVKQKLIEELQRKNRAREREEHQRLAPRAPPKESQAMPSPSTQIKQEPVNDEEKQPHYFDYPRQNGHSLSDSQQTLLLVEQTDQHTQTENEPSIPLSQVRFHKSIKFTFCFVDFPPLSRVRFKK